MARYPSAEWAPIAWMNSLRHTRKTQFTIHITAGESDPRTIATWKTGTAGANFVVFRDGRTIQLADSACKSAADLGATHTISVECVGADGPLTAAQCAALVRLIRDANRLDGVPLRLAATSSDAGIGWHRLGVDGNFPAGRMGGRLQRSPLGVKTSSAFGKLCPTGPVIDQIHDVILPAVTGGNPEEDDMSAADVEKIRGDINTVHEAVRAIPEKVLSTPVERQGGAMGGKTTLGAYLAWNDANVIATQGRIAALEEVVAKGSGVNVEDIRKAAAQGVADALESVETTVTVKKES
jgi:hypothetical protein